jgi:glycerophosphoryl diester phosphodiesterase
MDRSRGGVRIIAHRGASLTHRENTLEAFGAAIEQGADGIELDVRLSGDDVLVIHHDAHLEDGTLIRGVDAADLPQHVPTLGQALEAVGDRWLNIEIKNVPDEPDYDAEHRISLAVAGLLAAHRAMATGGGVDGDDGVDGFIVSSFNVDTLGRLRRTDPTIPLALLVWGQADPVSLVARAQAHGFEGINPHDLLVDRSFVNRAHDAGLQVNVWTVDDPDRIRQLADFGVDGIITNDPAGAAVTLGRC